MGCGEGNQTAKETPKATPSKGDDNNGTTVKPVKELTLREKVVGEYEIKLGVDTGRLVLLENGVAESYTNGKKQEEDGKWKISEEGELHFTDSNGIINGIISVYRINKDSSITLIADITKEGEREDYPKEYQLTPKRIK